MNWLIWREYRQNRLIVFFGLGLLLLPYVAILGATAWLALFFGSYLSLWGVTERLMIAAVYSLVICQLAVALFGGNAIAGDRADRSAEFMAYLPISRARLVVAKVALAAAATAVIWIPNLIVLVFGIYAAGGISALPPDLRDLTLVTNIATVGLVFYGVAWLLSSLLNSPAFAVCGGLVTPLLVIMALGILDYMFVANGIHLRIGINKSTGYLIFIAFLIALGISGFAIGTWHYVRRVEP